MALVRRNSILALILFVVASCTHAAKDADISTGESESWLQRVELVSEFESRYPQGFPFLPGGVPYKVNMKIFPEELQQLEPILVAYPDSQEKLRDRLAYELEASGWECDIEIDTTPALVYRFTARKDGRTVMASIMNLGEFVGIQIIELEIEPKKE